MFVRVTNVRSAFHVSLCVKDDVIGITRAGTVLTTIQCN